MPDLYKDDGGLRSCRGSSGGGRYRGVGIYGMGSTGDDDNSIACRHIIRQCWGYC